MGDKETHALIIAEDLDGPLLGRYRDLAKDSGLWLSLGGFPEKVPGEKRAYNTHLIIDDQGQIVSTYRKIHLFDVTLPTGQSLKESEAIRPGDSLEVCETPLGSTGLAICYDLRFPELFLGLTRLGARVILVPAAFTLITGKDHWETLLRARAIENQCYVIAAAQTGRHNTKRQSFGNAMIIDPWGAVVARVSEGEGIACASLDFEYLQKVRSRLPVATHRRPELFTTRRPESEAPSSGGAF